ncbi:MAG: cysteine desulfurase [Myxococcota bacterium]
MKSTSGADLNARNAESLEAAPLNVARLREEFPALHQRVNDKPLVYLDSAATALKPKSVVDTVVDVYQRDCANVHRAVHALSQRATESYESARDEVRDFIGAQHREEIIFVRGTTDAMNLLASSLGAELQPGDEVVVTELEHHSNFVPWQMMCERKGAKFVVVPVEDDGQVDLQEFQRHLSERTRIVSIAHISNALGTILPVRDMARLAHRWGARVVIDGAQGIVHSKVDVAALECDFYAFSGHKVYGPSGIGVLYGRRDILESMVPYQGGGDMIDLVRIEGTTFNELPYKFEAGTPSIAAAIGLGEALRWLRQFDWNALQAHEASLLEYGTKLLSEIPGLRLIGTAPRKTGVLSFVMEDAHPQDIGTVLDKQGIAIRTGHHCAQPLMERFKVPATARASLGIYNTKADIDALAQGLHVVHELFAP